jgi:hypothetical protein
MIKNLLVLCLLLFGLVLVGCKQKADAQKEVNDVNAVSKTNNVAAAAPKKTVSENAVTSQLVDNTALVTVNGVAISERQVSEKIDAELRKVKTRMPDQFIGQYKKELRSKIINEMTAQLLLDEQVKAKNITVSEQELTAYVEAMFHVSGAAAWQELKKMVTSRGQDFEQIKKEMPQILAREKLLSMRMPQDSNIPETELRAYYTGHPQEFEANEPASQLPFDQVKDTIKQRVVQQKQKQLADKYIQTLKDQAKIVYAQ